MKRTLFSIAVLVAASVAIVSCGGKAKNTHTVSGLAFRAFVSNPLFPSGTTGLPVINIVNATNDALSTSDVGLATAVPQADMMALSPNLKNTLVYSESNTAIAIIDNSTEAIATAGSSTTSLPSIALPGQTSSFFVGSDNATAYIAVPTAPVTGFSPGIVDVVNITTGSTNAQIPVASAHWVVPTVDGTRTFVFSDNSDSVSIITNILIGSSSNPVSTIPGFDRPVWALFSSDNSTAYIFDCGPECGGTQAGISVLDLSTGTIRKTIPLSGATTGLISGNFMYVVGSPPGTKCGSNTSASHCGTLNVVSLNTLSQSNASPILITDGYHNRIQISQNGQLFVGSFSCSNVSSPSEQRGCLTIFNTLTGAVVVPPIDGDATGLQPIPGRDVVYVCQGGAFYIYDTTTDAILVQTVVTDIPGRPTDVKIVDPPN